MRNTGPENQVWARGKSQKTVSPRFLSTGIHKVYKRLAAEWGTIAARPRIRLVAGERQRDRVLSDSEVNVYLAACGQPWKDCATIMLGTAMRPAEVFALRWENISFQDGGLIRITEGKSKTAKRVLPMLPVVRSVFENRWSVQGQPSEGWVFPSSAAGGHFDGNSSKNQHHAALNQIAQNAAKQKQPTPLTSFEPYCLRHTALTRLGESGCDAFTLARIAGHSDIKITMRYVHPQAEAIALAFKRLDGQAQAVAAEEAQRGREGCAGGHKTGHNRKRRLLPPGRVSVTSSK